MFRMNSKKFVLCFLLVVFTFSSTNKLFYYILNDADNLTLKEETEVVVLGASHGAQGVNPICFDNLENLCVAGEQLFVSREKLSLITNRVNKISKVILILSPSTFSESRDKNNRKKESYFNNLLMYMYLFDDKLISELSDYEGLDKRIRDKFVFGLLPPSKKELKALVKYFLGANITQVHPGWGGYYPMGASNLDKEFVDRRLSHHYYYENEIEGILKGQVEKLDEIIAICEDRRIQLFLVRTPEHDSYSNNIPMKYSLFFNELIKNRINNSSNVNYLNFVNLKLNDDCFRDGDHLNDKGSLIFSKVLKDSIK